MTEEGASLNPLIPVLARLEGYFTEEPEIKKRASEIESLIDEFYRKPEDAQVKLRSTLSTLRYYQEIQETPPREVSPYLKKRFENALTAYLIYQLEESKKEEGFKIRPDQIEGVITLLEKNQLQASTGFGKSAYVLPLTALVTSLSANDRTAVVATSPELKGQLLNHIENLRLLLPAELKPDLYQHKKTEESAITKTSEDFKAMARCLIQADLENSKFAIPEELRQKQLADYLKSLFMARFFEDAEGRLVLTPTKSKPSVCLFEENDDVFFTIQNEKEQFAHTYFDEIHVPRSRNSIYYTTSPSALLPEELVRESLIKRFLSQFLKEAVEQEALFAEKKGGFWFVDEEAGQKRIGSLIRDMAKNEGKASQYRKKTSSFMAENLGMNKEEFDLWIVNQLSAKKPKGFSDLVSELLLSLSKTKNLQEGVHYLTDREGIPFPIQVRDYFMGLLLPSHQFLPEDALALQAWENSFAYIDPLETASASTSFEGWVVNYLEGRISGLSNNLFTPKLTDPQKFKKTPLASFLEKATGHQAVMVGEKKQWFVPAPYILENTRLLSENLIESFKTDHRPIIIGCYNENEAKVIKKLVEEQLPQRAVLVADAHLSEEQAEKIYRQFVEQDEAILISTGRVGVGIDLKKPAGNFTDHKTIIYGLPFTSDQIFQLMGRRRLKSQNPENDFVWLLSKEQITSSSTFKYFCLDEKSQEKFWANLEKKPLETLARLIEVSENLLHTSDELVVAFDKIYRSALIEFQKQTESLAPKYFKKLMEELVLTEGDKKILEAFFQGLWGISLEDYFLHHLQAPGSLYWILRNQLSLIFSSSETGLLVEAFHAYFSQPKNYQNWIEAKKTEFFYLINILLSQIKSAPFYERIKQAKDIKVIPAAYVPLEKAEIVLLPTTQPSEETPTVSKTEEGQRVNIVIRDGKPHILVNYRNLEPIKLEKNEGIGCLVGLESNRYIMIIGAFDI